MMILLKYPLRLGASLIYLIWLYGLWKMVERRLSLSLWSIMLGTRWKRMETMVSFTMVKDSYTNIQVRSTGMPNIHTVTIQSWYKLCQSVVGVVVVENVITLIQHHTLYSVSYSIQTPYSVSYSIQYRSHDDYYDRWSHV